MKLPVSAEWLSSAAKTDFIERNLPASAFAPGRDWGVKLSGEPINRVAYQIGVFAGDGRLDVSRADTTAVGRLDLRRRRTRGRPVGSRGEVHADVPEVVDPLPRGLPFRAPSGFRFYERHFVDGTRSRIGADARYQHRSFGLKLEVLQMTQERRGQGSILDDLPTEVSRGWSARRLARHRDRQTAHHQSGAPDNRGASCGRTRCEYDSIDSDDRRAGLGFAASAAALATSAPSWPDPDRSLSWLAGRVHPLMGNGR